MPRDQVISRLSWLAREGLEREPSMVWEMLAANSVDIEALELLPELRRAYDEGLIDPRFLPRTELDEMESGPRGEYLERTRKEKPPIDDVVADTAWWDRGLLDPDDADPFEDDDFENDDFEDDDPGDDELEPWEEILEPAVQEPYRAPPKIGRNEPCPCGSGKKYKKCHGA